MSNHPRRFGEFLNKLREPWTFYRRLYWLSVLLSPLLARKIICRKCGRVICGAFIWIFRGKAYIFSKDRSRFRFCPEGPFALAFECVGGCLGKTQHEYVGASSTVDPKRILHAVLGHQKGSYLATYLRHHRRLAAEYSQLLVYGGSQTSFDDMAMENSVFCDDESLRGPAALQSYTRALSLAHTWAANQEEERKFDWIFFSEADLWGLQPHYASPFIAAVASNSADFGGFGLDDITCTNDTHFARALKDGFLPRAVARATGIHPQTYLHMLGACLVIRWSAFEKFCSRNHDDSPCYAEIYLPTVLAALGLRGIDVRQHTVATDVRYRPAFSLEEAHQLEKQGAFLIHPLKNPP